MPCYTTDSAARETLECRIIKAKTIKTYLAAASELSIYSQIMNSTLDLISNESKLISDVLHELKRWKLMYNEWEPVTADIVEFIVNL